jgi:hypothetical protein
MDPVWKFNAGDYVVDNYVPAIDNYYGYWTWY